MTGVVLAGMLMAATAGAASQGVDDAILSIRHAGREVGREDVTVRQGRGPDGRTAGTTIRSHVRYPAFDPKAEIAGLVERNPAGRPTVFQLEYRSGAGEERYLAAYEGRRITVHRFVGTNQGAREYPAGDFPVFLVDSSYAFYLALAGAATEAGRSVTAIYPRDGRREQITVTGAPPAGRGPREIHLSGAVTGSLRLDEKGAFLRLELPERQITVVRMAD